jgi:AcrR family transcriptional regulator
MPRPLTLSDEDLIDRLTGVFADTGYEGASLTLLAEASGLKRASLYHRFPGGKLQMAREVLDRTWAQIENGVMAPLRDSGSAAVRAGKVVKALDALYDGGRRACLLNMLAASRIDESPMGPAIRDALRAMVDGFTVLARDAGAGKKKARRKGEQVVMLLQGALILSRGTGDTAPFRSVLARLPDEIL